MGCTSVVGRVVFTTGRPGRLPGAQRRRKKGPWFDKDGPDCGLLKRCIHTAPTDDLIDRLRTVSTQLPVSQQNNLVC